MASSVNSSDMTHVVYVCSVYALESQGLGGIQSHIADLKAKCHERLGESTCPKSQSLPPWEDHSTIHAQQHVRRWFACRKRDQRLLVHLPRGGISSHLLSKSSCGTSNVYMTYLNFTQPLHHPAHPPQPHIPPSPILHTHHIQLRPPHPRDLDE